MGVPQGRRGGSQKRRGSRKKQPLGEAGVPLEKLGGVVSKRRGPSEKAPLREAGGPSKRWGTLREGRLLSERRGPLGKRVFSDKGVHAWKRPPQRSGSPREARGTGSRGPATNGARPSLTEVARRLCGRLLGPGRPRVAGSYPVRSGPAAAAPSGGARGGGVAATGRRTVDGQTERVARSAFGRRGCACARRGADPGREEPPHSARSRRSVSPLRLTLKLPASQPGFPGC